ncbi:MAG: hypothetical protein ACREJB_18950 [Planctomycetaceae bacterium]
MTHDRPQEAMTDKPIRAGVFDTVERADQAIRGLMDAGFTTKQITVICTDRSKERHFKNIEHEEPAGRLTSDALSAGGGAGLAVGGFVALGIVTAGGLPIVAAGALIGIGITGTLVALFTTRGFEKELADFYDQAVEEGRILIAVEDHEKGNANRLARAERVFADAGANPLALHEG